MSAIDWKHFSCRRYLAVAAAIAIVLPGGFAFIDWASSKGSWLAGEPRTQALPASVYSTSKEFAQAVERAIRGD